MERTLLIATIATSLLPISRAHHHYIQNAVTGSYWVLLRNTLLVAVRRQVGFQLRVVVLVQMLIELADSLNFHVDFFLQSLSRCQSVQQRVKIQPMCVLAPARQLHSNNNYLNDFMSVLKSPLPPPQVTYKRPRLGATEVTDKTKKAQEPEADDAAAAKPEQPKAMTTPSRHPPLGSTIEVTTHAYTHFQMCKPRVCM